MLCVNSEKESSTPKGVTIDRGEDIKCNLTQLLTPRTLIITGLGKYTPNAIVTQK